MNHHAPGQHIDTCHGPSDCAEYARLGAMSPTEFLAWLAADRAHWHAAAPASRHRVAQLRIAIDSARYAPPCGYRDGLTKMRADMITPRDLAELTTRMNPRGPDDFRPVDPYAAALALRKLQENR